eukprot:CAMPEP_0202693318 /NCGR_PEP_ID=MMETSP1385-20130828/7468_1 /ASSEMBLY_ACC=CAM_ASM_000861 /TAXON_ID=933848 /ORGANISM="Elphidium margaritaceum" /LENGTH=281 /DNA_ID=CAMNT_0049348979 /DNA_START=69 /DNA_END=911 /DNA_ORIENTATION=+
MSLQYARKVKRRNSSIRENVVSEEEAPAIKFSVTPEWWRFIAYLAFWGMCILAIVVTKLYVKDRLAAGPSDGAACGPFQRNDPDFGVRPGEGFDFDSQSHLVHLFGFSNICANWDYSPSREITAMFYPLFEYSLLIYLFLDFVATTLAHKRGEIEPLFWRLSQIFFPICVFFCAQFRMIFVCLAYESAQQHTAGFLGLQIALILVAMHNGGFIWDANISYKALGGIKGTRFAVVCYVLANMIISSFKLAATIHVVRTGRGARWTLKPTMITGVVVGQIIDW